MRSILRQRRQTAAVAGSVCFCFNIFVLWSLLNKLNAPSCEKVDSSQQLRPNLALDAFRIYSEKASKLEKSVLKEKPEKDGKIYVSFLNRTDYVTCEDFKKLPRTSQAVRENLAGNRGITFMKINIGGTVVDVVHKEASHVFQTVGDGYKMSSARREVEYLNKLNGLPGVPRLYGYCVKESYIAYFVERIKGTTLCNDNGTTTNCSRADFLIHSIKQADDPVLAAFNIAFTTVRLFKILEERHLFVEDVSGINLMFNSDFEVVLVDADSLLFYNKNRVFSRLSCESNNQCIGPKGNLWGFNSLNMKIYRNCRDLRGLCVEGKCRGFDNSLHACGIAEWYLCRVIEVLRRVPHYYVALEKVCSCLREPYPETRCTFKHAATVLEKAMKSYLEEINKAKT